MINIEHEFVKFLLKFHSKGSNVVKREIENLVKKSPTYHPTMNWLFGLVLSELGEKGEHSFFEKLYSIKDDPLEDTKLPFEY